jgi:DEAD/DEAH box helicase domain-containing protein
MSLEDLLNAWKNENRMVESIAAWRQVPSSDGIYYPLPDFLHPIVINVLSSLGINSLYSHQIESLEKLNQGKNLVVTTGTASGKSLCYNLPVINGLLNNYDQRALYIFPTKALSQDQANSLLAFFKILFSKLTTDQVYNQIKTISYRDLIGIYDGDTPSSARTKIRDNSRILLTNPDMIHVGILPNHTKWAHFFENLQFIIIDEIHLYRGVFGSHIANVIRRLKRVASFYGSQPRFIMTSATIANPSDLASHLIEEEVIEINQDGAPHGKKHFIIYNPPIIEQELGIRSSSFQEASTLAIDLLDSNVQTIVFARSRRTVELFLLYIKEKNTLLKNKSANNFSESPEIRGYRSGYLASHRREIEAQLREGKAKLVVATNALELGVDIGDLTAVLLLGYPGSVASTRQQAGRAGRKLEPSLAILIASSDPLDQYLTRHPEYIFEKPVENALINPDNLLLLLAHLQCAAYELPFSKDDKYGDLTTELTQSFLSIIEKENLIHRSGNKYFWMSKHYPAQSTSLRNLNGGQILLRTETDGASIMIGSVDRYSAYWLTHPGAIYYHESTPYLVDELDLENNSAKLSFSDKDYYTEPTTDTTLTLLSISEEKKLISYQNLPFNVGYGNVKVTKKLIGYKRIRLYTGERLGNFDCELPPVDLTTTAFWLSLSEDIVSFLREQGVWRNDPNQYGSTWEIQRKLARQRDDYRCQICGVQENIQAHEVHHKIPFRWYMDAEQANQLSNLITLCPRCHQRAEATVKIHSGLAGLSHLFHHLAPLYLMCDIHDIGLFNDPKFQAFGGLPTVMIYDQYPDGMGFSQKLFELHHLLAKSSFETASSCPCTDGCPSCVGPGGERGSGGKSETLAILKLIMSDSD